jgi:ATP-binding cassette subfamily F protein 1
MDVISRKGGLGHSELEDNFSISQVQLSEHKWAQLENAVDIKIENSELKKHIGKRQEFIYKCQSSIITQGRRYGLVGPNG